MKSYRHIIYYLPCKSGSVYVNVTDDCLNECLFCIKREGTFFFGFDLSLTGRTPLVEDIIDGFLAADKEQRLKEVVFCGMGEPLLRYDCVLAACRAIKELRKEIKIRIDTSGLFWVNNRRLDFLDCIDILSISLNAENIQKYEELCQPKIPGAYEVLMSFLKNVRLSEVTHEEKGLQFPEIRLSIVDTSEAEFVPASGRAAYPEGTFPVPDFGACKKIANSFGWPLIVKCLFRDSRDKQWEDRSFEELCARGISPDSCRNCTYRH